MPPKTETVTLNETEFSCTQFTVMRQAALEARLLKLLGPVFSDGFFQLELSSLAGLFAASLGRLSQSELDSLILDILAGTSLVKDGRRIELNSKDKINAAFEDLWLLHKVLWFALETNYQSFFDSALAAFRDRLAQNTASP